MFPGLPDFQDAQKRLAAYVRRTPMIKAQPLKDKLGNYQLYFKLENLQITGSFKARGAVNKLLSLAGRPPSGLVTASGGNHGLGVAYAGYAGHLPVTVYLPESTTVAKAGQIAAWGALVVRHGVVWDEANRAAVAHSEREGLAYFHPFADPAVITGQGTVALEMLEDAPQLDTLLVAIGGGGLIAGIALAAHALRPDLKVIGVEPVGAPTLYNSLQAGRLVELDRVTTRAGTLAPRQSQQLNLDIISRHVEQIILVSDEEMETAQQWLFLEFGMTVELSAAAALAALLSGKYLPADGQQVGVVICGANSDVSFC